MDVSWQNCKQINQIQKRTLKAVYNDLQLNFIEMCGFLVDHLGFAFDFFWHSADFYYFIFDCVRNLLIPDALS